MCVDDTVGAEGRAPPRELYVYACVWEGYAWVCMGVYMDVHVYRDLRVCGWIWMYMGMYVYGGVGVCILVCVYGFVCVWVCRCVCALGKWSKDGEFPWESFFSVLGLSLSSQGPKMPPSVPLLVVTRPSTSRKSTWIFEPALSLYRACCHFLQLPLLVTSLSR